MNKQFYGILILLLCTTFIYAQPPKKPAKEKPPTQKEMQDMMKEAEKMMGEMSPEDKKMMDSMGIKMPDFKKTAKSVSGVTDKQLATAWEDENRIVPKKDDARIALANQQKISGAGLAAYLQKTHTEIINLLTAKEKADCEQAYDWITKKTGANKTGVANTAVQLWMMRQYKAAIYTLGKLLNTGQADMNTVNNYAAFLTMAGAEEKAMPLLNYLNSMFPKNSSILNNLSQAWYGLGDMVKAEKYADTVLLFCAWHPQANTVKSHIDESKGRTAEAVTHEKNAISKLYSSDKEERLRKLNYKLDGKDLYFPLKPDSDPMGMERFKHPDFPLTASEEVGLKTVWAEFKDQARKKAAGLAKQLTEAQEKYAAFLQKMQQHDLYVVKTSQDLGRPIGNLAPMPPFAKKAAFKLKEMEKDGGMKYRWEKAVKDLANYPVEKAVLKKKYDDAIAKLKEEDLEQTGEGKPNKNFCPKYADEVTKYLTAYNTELLKLTNDYLLQSRLKMSEELFWYQFVQYPVQFEVTKLTYQINWLDMQADIRYGETGFFDDRPLCIKDDEKKKGKSQLANYNDLNCPYKDTLKLGMGEIIHNCNEITAKMEIDIQGIKLFETEIKTNDENVRDAKDFADFLRQSFVSCTIAAGPSVEKEFGAGPFKLEAEIGVKGLIEIGKEGITDVGIKTEAEIKAIADAGHENKAELTIIGAEAKLTVNSGFSAEGKGILKTVQNIYNVITQ
jgi:hypothetical protein